MIFIPQLSLVKISHRVAASNAFRRFTAKPGNASDHHIFMFSDRGLLNSEYIASKSSGGSKGARGTLAPPWGSKFFQFHAVVGKFWQNRMLPPPESWRPLLGEILDPPLKSHLSPPLSPYILFRCEMVNYKNALSPILFIPHATSILEHSSFFRR